ncbi:hypothetical protein DFH06DRAFT_1330262 [Mycena polygramma]|nr:hypothetical protein DFH06DRAFT_1330262 [Mycena polygramma]
MSSTSSGSNSEQHQQPIPVLAPADVQHAIPLIQAAYAPSAATDLPQLQSLQSALLAIQRTPATWGLVVPVLAHEDANERFAPREARVGLAGVPCARVVLRKLYRGRIQHFEVRLEESRRLSFVVDLRSPQSRTLSSASRPIRELSVLIQVPLPDLHLRQDVRWGLLYKIVRADMLVSLVSEATPELEGCGCQVWETIDAFAHHPLCARPHLLSPTRACAVRSGAVAVTRRGRDADKNTRAGWDARDAGRVEGGTERGLIRLADTVPQIPAGRRPHSPVLTLKLICGVPEALELDPSLRRGRHVRGH